ncbi:hypothetical protein, partial [Escherichia coli]|uniref:hypothetical protein n=1 Tax=Escherichia coli TaxID=562 RepID=UPI003F23A6F7
MDATARDSNVIQPADTNGLEELFDVESAKAMPGNSQGTTLELEGCSLGIAQWLTVEEASK